MAPTPALPRLWRARERRRRRKRATKNQLIWRERVCLRRARLGERKVRVGRASQKKRKQRNQA